MKIAALQMQSVPGDPEANLERIEQAAREAAMQEADLLVTPELAITGYGAGEIIRDLAEPARGDLSTRLASLSLETGIALVVGFAERAGATIYNSALYIDGPKARAVYRKSHLYGPYERDLFAPEKPRACIVDHRGMKLGMLICYDVEFPENVRRLAQAGAQVVIVPTALPASDHAAFIARKLIPVRAFENQLFVAYVNHCGADASFAYAGLSGIAAPDGEMLAQAPEAGEALLVAEIRPDGYAARPDGYAASAAANSYLADLRT
ncbi:MAG: carbon-nitrogen hydrolase family protein [Pseudaminobacter sp.]|nr:carbon-nitrogen hydrolase family protein [Pseudaminobacter sp.]